jgi:hypothetical protein
MRDNIDLELRMRLGDSRERRHDDGLRKQLGRSDADQAAEARVMSRNQPIDG